MFVLKTRRLDLLLRSLICSTSAFLKYWAGLQDEEGKILLETGAEALKNAALLHHPQGPDRDEPRTGTVLLQ
jgi:hypothetical protein